MFIWVLNCWHWIFNLRKLLRQIRVMTSSKLHGTFQNTLRNSLFIDFNVLKLRKIKIEDFLNSIPYLCVLDFRNNFFIMNLWFSSGRGYGKKKYFLLVHIELLLTQLNFYEPKHSLYFLRPIERRKYEVFSANTQWIKFFLPESVWM